MNSDDAENAMKHMDGGQIDGNEVAVSYCHNSFTSKLFNFNKFF